MYTYQGLMQIVDNLVNFLIRVASLSVVAVMVWYGVQMVLAGGDSGKYESAKKGMKWAIIGAIVIFGVWTIIATVGRFVDTLGS